VSHLCGNGMIEMLELLEDIPLIEYNLPDSEGNTPLHLAAQAGHVDVVSFLLNKVNRRMMTR
jgi:ankyrin repeat protein